MKIFCTLKNCVLFRAVAFDKVIKKCVYRSSTSGVTWTMCVSSAKHNHYCYVHILQKSSINRCCYHYTVGKNPSNRVNINFRPYHNFSAKIQMSIFWRNCSENAKTFLGLFLPTVHCCECLLRRLLNNSRVKSARRKGKTVGIRAET